MNLRPHVPNVVRYPFPFSPDAHFPDLPIGTQPGDRLGLGLGAGALCLCDERPVELCAGDTVSAPSARFRRWVHLIGVALAVITSAVAAGFPLSTGGGWVLLIPSVSLGVTVYALVRVVGWALSEFRQ